MNLEWVFTVVSLLLATTIVSLVLALAYSPEPDEESPYA